ncbi:hypothetical protein D1BOALGB6SA_448 [Olavius sp. associated proteobacterium Delta 1]|nr:hypothetical protein D1BOALGB6SA_448 [Olavius sp. associated proteobacterium Delta 1]
MIFFYDKRDIVWVQNSREKYQQACGPIEAYIGRLWEN